MGYGNPIGPVDVAKAQLENFCYDQISKQCPTENPNAQARQDYCSQAVGQASIDNLTNGIQIVNLGNKNTLTGQYPKINPDTRTALENLGRQFGQDYPCEEPVGAQQPESSPVTVGNDDSVKCSPLDVAFVLGLVGISASSSAWVPAVSSALAFLAESPWLAAFALL